MDIDWLRAIITIGFGALAGGLTNRIAVWMLFHPYTPPTMMGRTLNWLQGAVPKNQSRLADSIGRVVGGTLLTPEDIASELHELEDAFQDRLRELAVELSAGEQPSLAEILPAEAVSEVRALLLTLLAEGRELLVTSIESPEFGAEAARLLETVRESLSEEPLSRTLEGERLEAVRDALEGWLVKLLDSEAFERTIRHHLDAAAHHVLEPGRTLEQLIPQGLVAALEHAIKDYLPVAMERLGRLLEDPETRQRVERLIRELLDRFMSDLRLHQRVVAKLIVTEETVTKALDTLEAEGADKLGEVLREPEVQSAMARNVNDGIVEFLRRPTTTVLGAIDSPQVGSALDSMSEWIVRAARDAGARTFLLDQLEGALGRLGERSWADVLRVVPADRVSGWLAVGLRSDAGRALFDSIAEPVADRILETPIGRLDRFLRDDAAVRLADTLGPPTWDWVARQVPEVADKIKISDRISAKIEGFPLQRLEGLVRDISQRELDLIVRLGYLLGGFIGAILVIINTILG
ncbi:MAG: DUF445 domain-containing protein [Gemmatimonadetes bacterium]|nr:DUF445 domain-containing protein [Gemmatimonadota bacterium]